MKPHIFEQGPPLRGGFCNPLPFVDAGQSLNFNEEEMGPALHGIDCHPSRVKRPTSISGPAEPADEYQFPESFAATCEALKDKCAPPVITYFPRGSHYGVTPIGAARGMDFHIDETWALRLDRQLKAIRAAGKKPFFDFNHTAGVVGYPQEFFWRGDRGVCALVNWNPEGEKLILSGECNGFSPAWVHMGNDILGIKANCGALVHRSCKPAFGVRMPKILPVTKNEASKICSSLFIRKIDRLVTSGTHTAVQACEQLRIKFPFLHAAYALRAAISREFAADAALIEECAA